MLYHLLIIKSLIIIIINTLKSLISMKGQHNHFFQWDMADVEHLGGFLSIFSACRG